MTVNEKECLFMKYTREVVDYMDTPLDHLVPHRPYGYLLKRCTCKNCMIEKEQNRKVEEKRKNDRSKNTNKKD